VSRSRAAPGRPEWAAPLVVAGAVGLVFLRSVSLGFVEFDDQHLVLENPAFRGFGVRQLRWMLSTALLGHHVPVTWLSFAADYRIWGLRPEGYHLGNVVLHAMSAGLVVLLAMPLVARATGWPSGRSRLAAAVAGLLWGVHPLRVEAVSWIPGRRDVLSTTFLLLALGAYLRAREATAGRRVGWRAAATVAYALAVGAKEVVMVFPAALVLLEVYPLGGLPPDPLRWAGRPYRGVWTGLLPLLGVAGLGAAAGFWAAQHVPVRILRPDEWLGQLAVTVWFHVWKTVVPLGLSPLYEFPDRFDWAAAPLRGRALVAAGISLAVAAGGRRWPAGVVAWGWYLAFLAPVTATVHNGPQLTADRYGYVPTLGLFVLAGVGAVHAAARGSRPRLPAAGPVRRWPALLVGTAVAAAVLISAGLAWRQQGIWRDAGTLWAAAVRATPACVRCRVNHGNWLAARNRVDEALAEYGRALELAPDRVEVRTNIGLLLLRVGRAEEAIPEFEAVVAALPARVPVRVNLARALVAAGRRAEAVARLEEGEGYVPAGTLVDFYRELTRSQPDAPVPRLGLVQAYARAGDCARAREAHARLAELDPELARLVARRLPPVGCAGRPAGPGASARSGPRAGR